MQNAKIRMKNCGFVLLFTLLISSILLATGLGVSRLMVRQIGLASLSRDSQVAFFAADSGMECALYWIKSGKFTPEESDEGTRLRNIYCNGVVIKNNTQSVIKGATNSTCDATGELASENVISGDGKSCFAFSMVNGKDRPSCTFVVVDKAVNNINPLNPITTTTITSNGYNRCDLSLPNVLERTLEFTETTCDSPDQTCGQI